MALACPLVLANLRAPVGVVLVLVDALARSGPYGGQSAHMAAAAAGLA